MERIDSHGEKETHTEQTLRFQHMSSIFISEKQQTTSALLTAGLRILVTYISSDVGRDYWEEIKYLYRILKHQTLGPNDQGEEMLIIFDLLLAAFILPNLFHTPVSALRCIWQCWFGDLKHEKEDRYFILFLKWHHHTLKACTFWSSLNERLQLARCLVI